MRTPLPLTLPGRSGLSSRSATGILALRVVLTAALAAYAVHVGTGAGGALFEDWIYDGILVGAAALCLLRAILVHEERVAWLALGVGLALWSAGVVLVTLRPQTSGAFPAPADVLWLAFYPAAYCSLVLLVRARVHQFYASLWLDGLVGALALSAIVAATLFPSLLPSAGASPSALLADLSYPVADLLLVGLAVWVVALTGWRPGRVLGLVAAGVSIGAVADGFSLWWAVSGHTVDRTPLDWLWPASTLMLATAAWQPPRPSPLIRLSGLRPMFPPVVFAVSALALLLLSRVIAVDTAGFVLASATLVAVILRMAITFGENMRMVDRSRHEAMTDALTGLGNRRRLMSELREALQISSVARPQALMIFDLDGFKLYNDTFGHSQGDTLLARLGHGLHDAVGEDGRAYRLGGDEFCALVHTTHRSLEAIAAAATEALCERGSGFTVSTSYGVVMLPAEADDVSTALQIADERLYANKGDRRRAREGQQTLGVLQQILHESAPGLYEHLHGVAALARPVGARFGMTADELDEMARAAELHDIGKIAVPDAILGKAGELDGLERALMDQHTLVGERILGAAAPLRPVARLVRSSHEHFDGRGYPDGLSGDAIPLAARIIAVCDAYDAMTTDRPYARRVDAGEALAELRRCSGTQFDPAVVDVFAELLVSPAQGPLLEAA